MFGSFLFFDDTTRDGTFSVFVTDDSSLEDMEYFLLEFQFDPIPSNIQLIPDIAVINIVDNDGMI